VVEVGNRGFLHTTLGGAGLAVSSFCADITRAVDYIKYATSPEIQRTLYVESGGQPGHRTAWLDDMPNLLMDNFFRDTIKTHDISFLRPRYNGYIRVQAQGGAPIRNYLQNGGNEKNVLSEMNTIYQQSI
jgi:multiple sugar transport system substrate-binding protein